VESKQSRVFMRGRFNQDGADVKSGAAGRNGAAERQEQTEG